jgi:hypothetical protein
MSNDTRIVTEQDEEAFWMLMSRPVRTVVLAKDVLAAVPVGTHDNSADPEPAKR